VRQAGGSVGKGAGSGELSGVRELCGDQHGRPGDSRHRDRGSNRHRRLAVRAIDGAVVERN
jgi:hypothetical protein